MTDLVEAEQQLEVLRGRSKSNKNHGIVSAPRGSQARDIVLRSDAFVESLKINIVNGRQRNREHARQRDENHRAYKGETQCAPSRNSLRGRIRQCLPLRRWKDAIVLACHARARVSTRLCTLLFSNNHAHLMHTRLIHASYMPPTRLLHASYTHTSAVAGLHVILGREGTHRALEANQASAVRRWRDKVGHKSIGKLGHTDGEPFGRDGGPSERGVHKRRCRYYARNWHN